METQASESWRNHKLYKHTVLAQAFLCTFCGKAFTKKANMEQHITLHTGEKKYQCLHCEKRFRSHSVYQNHVRGHLGKKEFVCQFCAKAFMQKSHLARHTATHTEQGETLLPSLRQDLHRARGREEAPEDPQQGAGRGEDAAAW